VTDDRIHQYLADRADAIELRPTDPSAIVKRAHSRKQRRRVGAIALCALAIGASAVVVTQRDDPKSETSTASSGVVESTFDWAVVEPSAGLGYSTSSALTDDGVIYSLSTAPGQMDTSGNPWAEPATLYRSGDGAEWTEVDLPGDLWASALAGAGGRLYAVGTAPAGGGAVFQVATSDDRGESWTETEVPSELTDLQQRYGREVFTSKPTVAVHDGTVIVSASIFANVDVESRLPGGVPAGDSSWTQTDDGIVVTVGAGCSSEPGWAPTTITVMPEQASGAKVATTPPPEGCQQFPYTWDELGVDEELGSLIGGRNYVFVSRDGGEFEAVDLGEEYQADGFVVATDDGFTLFAWQPEQRGGTGSTRVLHSADGVTWDEDIDLPGLLVAAGVQDGRPAVALMQGGDSVLVRIAQPDGSWSMIDPRIAVDEAGQRWVGQVAFGPLGWAATVQSPDESGPIEVVHSVGSSLAVVPLTDLLERPAVGTVDITVGADSIALRVTEPGDGDPTTVTPQRVVVGTPRG
jgi:hypothetical protein